MEKREMVYEGKAKKVFRTDDEKLFVIQYKDDATAFNGEKKGTIGGKGIINNNMSVLMFKMLEEHGIPTHLVEHMNDRETLVKAVTILPLEVIVRNVAAGSFSKRYGVTEGTVLPFPTFEFSYKNDDLGDPLINESHALAMGIATQEQMDIVRAYALKINELMKDFFLVKGIKLIDFKLEFGLFEGEVVLADEISPDTCRFWDVETNEKLDKDRFRRDLGNVEEAYQEIMKRLSK